MAGAAAPVANVATVQDEHGRQRRLTKDTFGRLAKVEELNWGGSSVYATTDYTYNVRDQITQSNQAGQLRTFAYDGHGRLKSRTTPEQGTTTYSYNNDDTTNVLTDARGVNYTFGYNPRHLVTSINYGLVGGVPTAPVNFVYDAAGNRTSMSDGLGSRSYVYDQLSRMTSETRSFTGVTGSFDLSYGYNLVGELTSITNEWGSQAAYAYDKIGRVTGVMVCGALDFQPMMVDSRITSPTPAFLQILLRGLPIIWMTSLPS